MLPLPSSSEVDPRSPLGHALGTSSLVNFLDLKVPLVNSSHKRGAAATRASILTLSLRCVCLWSTPSKGTLTSVGRKDSADSVVLALWIMGTLEGMKTNPGLTFDGTAKQWPAFKQKLLKYADSQNLAYMLEAGQIIFAIFQAASATAAESKPTGK